MPPSNPCLRNRRPRLLFKDLWYLHVLEYVVQSQSATIIIKGSKQLGLNQLLTCLGVRRTEPVCYYNNQRIKQLRLNQLLTCLGVRTEPVCYYNNQRIKTAWTESVTYMSWSTEPVCYYNNQRIKTAWTESVTYMSWSTFRASLLL